MSLLYILFFGSAPEVSPSGGRNNNTSVLRSVVERIYEGGYGTFRDGKCFPKYSMSTV